MENVWVLASTWVGLSPMATPLAIWFKISTALTEILLGIIAQLTERVLRHGHCPVMVVR